MSKSRGTGARALRSKPVGLHTSAQSLRPIQDADVLDKLQVKYEGKAGEARLVGETLRGTAAFMKLPTFGIVILQGVVGSTPWWALFQ